MILMHNASILSGPASVMGESHARERRRDAALTGASERERTTGGHIWSRGPRGSQVTLASDGASRFHDDVLAHALASLYLGFPPFLFPHRPFPRRLSHAGHQKYRRLFHGWERRGGIRGWEQERSVISRLSGITGFLELCRSSPFPISSVSSISRAVSLWFLRFQDIISRGSSSSFARKIAEPNSWIVEVNVYSFFFLIDYYLKKFFKKCNIFSRKVHFITIIITFVFHVILLKCAHT